eukprot:9979677-Ditylum_brightwellii.AAC.1
MQQQQLFPIPQQQPFTMQQQQSTPFQQQVNLFQQQISNGTSPFLQKYCWMHGERTHTGIKCQTPADGHQPHATFYNKMGGIIHNRFI